MCGAIFSIYACPCWTEVLVLSWKCKINVATNCVCPGLFLSLQALYRPIRALGHH